MARILLVDDDRFARDLYARTLVAAGHLVDGAGGGREAMALFQPGKYELVLTDLLMPGFDGMALLNAVRDSDPDCAVVVITALHQVDPAVRALRSGAADYLVKPITPEALALAVGRSLQTRALLREHAEMKRSLRLYETAQRLGSLVDREELHRELSHALQREASAAAAILLDAQGALLGAAGVDPDAAAAIAVEGASVKPGERITLPPGAPRPELTAVSLDDGFRALLVVNPGEPTAGDAERVEFLCRHGALALRNLTRMAEVRELAYVDDLTGLYNTRYFEVALERELRPDGAFSLLFLDLDRFKAINDEHGHLVGSKVLIEVGRLLKSCVREHDVVCRWGGDEFTVILPGTDSGGALKVAERIRRVVEEHAFLAREALRLRTTACIGVASYPEHARDRQALMDLADRAMYRGKRGTRNIVYVASHGSDGP